MKVRQFRYTSGRNLYFVHLGYISLLSLSPFIFPPFPSAADLHYGEDFASPETVDAAYGSDDVSQFAIDDEENLNVVLIDIGT